MFGEKLNKLLAKSDTGQMEDMMKELSQAAGLASKLANVCATSGTNLRISLIRK